MDSSFIFIDGPVLWLVLIYLLLQFVMFCILGNAWLKAQRESDRQDKLIKKLRSDNNELFGQVVCEEKGRNATPKVHNDNNRGADCRASLAMTGDADCHTSFAMTGDADCRASLAMTEGD